MSLGTRKCIGVFLCFLALLFAAACSSETGETWVVVERVVDGDTFVTDGGERVRLIGVDTPESVKPNSPVEPFGKEASRFTKKMLEGKRVRLERDVQEKDKYGRTLAYVYLEDGTFYNELLVREGYAQVLTVPPNVKYADRLLEAQKAARNGKKGLWGMDGLDVPYVDENGKGLIKGNINSKGEKIYHLPGGKYYEQTVPEEWFATEREAIQAGYRRAKE